MLRVIEIFASVQGESGLAGWPTAFVRLAACNLRCVYCDTPYSFGAGEAMDMDAVMARVEGFGVRHACITGGEPMLQPDAAVELMARLLARGYVVSLETNGTIALDPVPPEVVKIVDVKTPGGLPGPRFEERHLYYPNLALLGPKDEVKLVLTSRADYEWSRAFVQEHRLAERCAAVLFSPAWGQVEPRDLVAWILEDRLPVRLNLQLHKVIWGPQASGV